MARITAIETQKRNPARVNIHLDGDYAFSLTAIVASGLRVGLELEPIKIKSLLADDAVETAYHKVARLIDRRTRSEAEIRQYLLRQKTPGDVLERTLIRLRKNDLADDGRFAQAWIDNRGAFRPRSRRALTWELRRKGVPAETIESVVSPLDDADLAYQAGLKQAGRLRGSPWGDFRRKLYAYLGRRGFASDVIGPAIARLWSETTAGQPPFENEETV